MGTPLRAAAVALAWAATLTFPAGGAAEPLATRTIPLGWSESAAAGRTLMTVRVRASSSRGNGGASWRRSPIDGAAAHRAALRLAGNPEAELHELRGAPREALHATHANVDRLGRDMARGTWHGQAAGILKPARFLRVGFDRFSGPALPGVPGLGVVTDNVERL